MMLNLYLFLGIIKSYKKWIYSPNKSSIKPNLIKTFLFYYIQIFNWVIFLPNLNISFFLLFNKNNNLNFLKVENRKFYKNNSKLLFFPLIFNIFQTIILQLIISIFQNTANLISKSSEPFLTQNFSKFKLINVISEILLLILYNVSNDKASVIIFFNCFCLYKFFSFFQSYPYKSFDLNVFHLTMIFILESKSLIQFIENFILFDESSENSFFLSLIQVVIFYFVSKVILMKIYEHKIKKPLVINCDFNFFSFLIEEFLQSAYLANDNKKELLKFYSFLNLHQKYCESNCPCKNFVYNNSMNERMSSTKHKQKKIKSKNRLINMGEVCKFIESLYYLRLRNINKRDLGISYEICFIKYITFLIEFRQNYVKAYYLLSINNVHFENSFSFIFKILEVSLFKRIFSLFDKKEIVFEDFKKKKEKYNFVDDSNFKNYFKAEENTTNIKENLISILEKIIEYWDNVYVYRKMDQFLFSTINLASQIKNLKKKLKKSLLNFPNNVKILKLSSIFYCSVENNLIESEFYEKKFLELKKIDMPKDVNLIHNISIFNGKVSSIIASFLKNWGKIIHYSHNCCTLFGFYF